MADRNGDGIDDDSGLPVGPGGGQIIPPFGKQQGPSNEYDQYQIPPGFNALAQFGRPGYFYNPQTGEVGLIHQTSAGNTSFTTLSVAEAKRFLSDFNRDFSNFTGQDTSSFAGGAGSGGAGGGGGSTTDPRYWDLQYRQLSDQEKQFADNLAYQYQNAGMDSETARRQALAGLLANRNNNAVALAQEAGSQAKVMADYAANPRDAVAELQYRNLTGGVPFGDINNPKFPQYTTALQDKAQALFGPQAKAFSQAQQYVNSPPPLEYLSPETRGQLGVPTGQQLPSISFSGAGGMPAPSAPAANPLASLMGASPEQEAALRQIEGNRQMASANPEQTAAIKQIAQTRGYSKGGRIKFPRVSFGNITGSGFGSPGAFDMGGDITDQPAPGLVQGYRPPTSEGGTNMTIHEPSMVVGAHSGHVYATLSEHNPEQMIIKPLPSVQRAQKEKMKSGQDFLKATAGAKRNAAGGEINFGTDPSEFIANLRQTLSGLGGTGGGVGGFGTKLPSPRLLAGGPANQIAQDPVLQDYLAAGYSSLGIDPRTVNAAIQRYTPQGVTNNLPRVSFA